MDRRIPDTGNRRVREAGFSLIELLLTAGIFLAVSAIVLTFMFDMTRSQSTIANRTDMHASVRSVTEVLQQEISQAGRVALPGNSTTLTAAVTGSAASQSVSVASSSGMFPGMLLVFAPCGSTCPANADEEIVPVVSVDSATAIHAVLKKDHGNGAKVRASGAFPTGILTTANSNTLAMYGDINDDGNMVFVVYKCTPNDTGTGTVQRSQTAWNSGVTTSNFVTLLNNLAPNVKPDGTVFPCFSIQTKTATWTDSAGANQTATVVVNVAVTMTARALQPAQPARVDNPSTTHVDERYDYETKALLTVAPRNTFQAWELSSISNSAWQHIQPTPGNITTLFTASASW